MRILCYTDSRGSGNGKHDRHYSDILNEIYDVEMYICPEKWTTTIDFLELWKSKNTKDYDLIVLHTSVVENSPRNKHEAYHKIYLDKKRGFDSVFGESNMLAHFSNKFDVQYEGEDSLNMFSLQMGVDYLVPILDNLEIPVIWITNNPLFQGDGSNYRGTYFRERPKNMSIIVDYSKAYIDNMKNVNIVDLTSWTDGEIKKYTHDNLHFTRDGSDMIYKMINEKIKELNLE